MSHYSEMSFLFNNESVRGTTISNLLTQNSENNTADIIKVQNRIVRYTSYKGDKNAGTNKIKNFLQENVYKNENKANPYIELINYFNSDDFPSLQIKASDIAYLRDLGVYPTNRMAILRRFPDGSMVPENLTDPEMIDGDELYFKMEPISTIIGWVKADQQFSSKINFSETWSTTNKRLDVALKEIIEKYTKIDITKAVPLPDFAQGLLFEAYKNAGLAGGGGTAASNDEEIESYSGDVATIRGKYGFGDIPIGDANLLMEGPFRDPTSQNIKTDFSFNLTTVYEQKIIGDVDPGSAMLDILDNIYAMGIPNMIFYWNENSEMLKKARKAVKSDGNSPTAWWSFIMSIITKFWDGITGLFTDTVSSFSQTKREDAEKTPEVASRGIKAFIPKCRAGLEDAVTAMKTILSTTLQIHRFQMRGSIELMVGGKFSSTPWYLTIGNPYSPWLATNHIVVKSCSVETSTEMGFNDQPQWLSATYNCQFSRALGKQELMRMFNNTYKRSYSMPLELIEQYTKRIGETKNLTELESLKLKLNDNTNYEKVLSLGGGGGGSFGDAVKYHSQRRHRGAGGSW